MNALLILLLLLVVLPYSQGVRAFQTSVETDPQARAQSLLELSAQQNLDNHAEALATAQQALVLWEELGDKTGIAKSHSQIGRCYFAQSDLPQAITEYEQALAQWRELQNSEEEAEALIMMGFIESRKGAWRESISFFVAAESLLDEQAAPAKMGQVASGLGYILNESGLPDDGLRQYQRALFYYQQTPDIRDDNLTLISIGKTEYLRGNFSQALINFGQACDRVSPDSLDAALCHHNIGKVLNALNEPSAAIDHLQTALAIYLRTSNPNEAAQVQALIGQAYELRGQLAPAQQSYEVALETFNRLADRLNQAAVCYRLGRLQLKRNDLSSAENYLRQSVELTEDIRRVSSSSDLTAAFSATVHDRYQSYIQCLMRRHQEAPHAGLATRSFELSEIARARSLNELLRATQTNLAPGVDPQLAEQEKVLRQTLRVKEDYKVSLLARDHKQAELDNLQAELTRVSKQYEEVRESIRKRYPAYDQISRPVHWTLEEIQQRVISDDDTLLLEYSLGAERSFVWAVTRDAIVSYELPPQSKIAEAAGLVHRWLSSPPGVSGVGAQLSPAALLSAMVLDPVKAELKKKTIIVVADDALNYIPFQVLPAPGTDEPLVANFQIVNVPSASILGQLRQEAIQRRPTKTLAAFGNPVFASNFAQSKTSSDQAVAFQLSPNSAWHSALRDIELNGERFDPSVVRPLFYAKRELANLRAVAGEDSLLASDFNATRENLLNTDLTRYAILHIATHGFLDPKRPEHSGLVLSTVDRDGKELNGFVGLQDIYQLRAPVDLVVLSACQTGLGKDVRGEGLLGLTRGFMYAGASSVVASLWKVDDEATAALMKQFYENMLQKGMTPSAALREAQNTIRQRPEWSQPYYWAAFTLQGEYRNPITPKARNLAYSKPLVVGTIVVLLALATSWYLRRRRGVHSTVKK